MNPSESLRDAPVGASHVQEAQNHPPKALSGDSVVLAGALGADTSSDDPWSFMPKQWQLTPKLLDIPKNQGNRPSPELIDARTFNRLSYEEFQMGLSECEYYQVISVARTNDVAYLLHLGFRDAQSVRHFFTEKNVEHLWDDKTSVVIDAMKREITASGFIRHYESLRKDYGALRTNFGDLLLFSTLGYRDHRETIKYAIAMGTIDLKDVQYLGPKRLSHPSTLNTLVSELILLKRGKAGYSLSTLRRLLDYAEDFTGDDLDSSLDIMKEIGINRVSRINDLKTVVTHLRDYSKDVPDRVDRALYRTTFIENLNDKGGCCPSNYCCDQFYDSGLSAEEAAQKVNDGHNVQQIVAAQNGVPTSLTDGWL